MQSVTVRVPAKVNLYLGVGPRQFDGYHELATVFQSVGIYDEVTIDAAEEFEIIPAGHFASGIPTDDSNIVSKAVALVARACGEDPNVAVTINKSIPVAAGMAGGSADAAAALIAADAFWKVGLPRDQLEAMAASLGADVPFMLHGGCAIGTGRGDVITPVMTRGTYHWVFAMFDEGLSTAAVYGRFDNLNALDEDFVPQVSTEVLTALAHADSAALGKSLKNDLQVAALTLQPRLGSTLDFGLEYGALGAIVSGSGPTCAFLTRDEKSAIDLTVALSGSGLCDSAVRTHGPVHGARIILH